MPPVGMGTDSNRGESNFEGEPMDKDEERFKDILLGEDEEVEDEEVEDEDGREIDLT